MNSDELAELCDQCDVRCSQSEIPDISFSPGSQDSLSNIVPYGFEVVNCMNLIDARNNDRFDNPPVSDCDFAKDQYRLIVSFESQIKPVTKSTAWTYSESLKRLYVNIGQPCPITIRLEPAPQIGFRLRCFLRYTKTAYVNDPVVQCANHSTRETNSILQGHVLRSNEIGVQYEKDERTGCCSISFPYNAIQDGVGKDLFVFEFKCLTTCFSRRTTKLVFVMECDKQVLCSYAIDVRICSCPGRDRRHDEEQFKDHGSVVQRIKIEKRDGSSYSVARKRPCADDDVYTIQVRGLSNYKLLSALKEKLEKADGYEGTSSTDQIKTLDHVNVRELKSPEPVKEHPKASQQSHSSSGGSSRSQKFAQSQHQNTLLQQSQKALSMTGKKLKNKVSLQVPEHLK